MVSRIFHLMHLHRNARWFVAMIGISILGIGQYLIVRQGLSTNPSTALGGWLNNTLHLSEVTIDNAYDEYLPAT